MPAKSRNILLTVFAEQRGALLRFLQRRLGNAALAEDLAQDTWVRAASAGDTTAIDNPRGYLFSIAANLVLDHQRRSIRRVEVPAHAAATVADAQPSPETVALHRSEFARLVAVVERLPPRGREVFILAKFDGLTYAEIAARLGISRNTVITHMVNALVALEREMAPPQE